MDKDWFIKHRVHIETYNEFLSKSLDELKTEKEYDSFFMWRIELETKRLNRYMKTLKPDEYIDHQLAVNEQVNLLNWLKELYNQFKGNDELEADIIPIKLNYGSRNEEVLKLLYQHLYPKFIDVDMSKFKSHFESYTNNQIRWKGRETTFVYLFEHLEIENQYKWDSLSSHFKNSNDNHFKPQQLANVNSKLVYQKKVEQKELIDSLLSEIKCITI